jgi:phage shock protein PspC (stress-responsive transcriptional regulator)
MSITDELERLQALRERGALSEAEYLRAKTQLLAESGAPASDTPDDGVFASERRFLRQLARSRSDRWLGGVCGGLGRHTALPPWAWRLIFVLVTLYFGSGLLFYLLLWVLLPQES